MDISAVICQLKPSLFSRIYVGGRNDWISARPVKLRAELLQKSPGNALAELEEAVPRILLERTEALVKILYRIAIWAKPGPKLGPGEKSRHGGARPGPR